MREVWSVVLVFAGMVGCAEELTRPPLSVRVLYPLGGTGDVGFADSVSYGVTFARWQFRLDIEEFEPTTIAEASDALERVLAGSASSTLVITVGSDYAPFLDGRSCELGRAYVLHLDGPLARCDRLRSITYRTFAPSFEAGVAAMEWIRLENQKREDAGQTTLPLRAGAFGAVDIAPVREFLDGFVAGVAHAGGEIEPPGFLAADSSGFQAADEAQALARELFEQAPVVFPVAGRAGLGAVTAAATLRENQDQPYFVIGADTDLSPIAPSVVLASVLKRSDRTVREAMFDLAAGQFSSGDLVLDSDDGFTGLLVNLLHETQVDPDDPFGSLALSTAVEGARSDARAAEEAYSGR